MVRKSSKISAYSRYKLLKTSLINPNNAPDWLIEACQTQGNLASLNKPDIGIIKMAKNSMQAAADEAIEDGGWEQLEILRIQLKDFFSTNKRKSKKNKYTISDARQETASYKDKLILADRHRVRLNRAYYDLMNIAQESSLSNPKIKRLLEKHISIYGRELGLTILKEDTSDA